MSVIKGIVLSFVLITFVKLCIVNLEVLPDNFTTNSAKTFKKSHIESNLSGQIVGNTFFVNNEDSASVFHKWLSGLRFFWFLDMSQVA